MSELATGAEVQIDLKKDPAVPLLAGFEFTPSSASVTDPSITFERVEEALGRVRDARSATSWWLGDLLRFTESRWGEMYAQAMESTGLSYGHLANIVSTCERVPAARRRDDLSYKHHEAIAALEAEEQTEWLEAAASATWSSGQLREALRDANALKPPTRTSKSAGSATAAATVDTARNLSVVREALDLVQDALEGGDATEIIGKLEAKLPEALQALDDASEPVRQAALGAELTDIAKLVVREATLSGGFYMVPTDVFESLKAALPT